MLVLSEMRIRNIVRTEITTALAPIEMRLVSLEKGQAQLIAITTNHDKDISVLKQDVTVLKQDVTVLKQDVAVLKQDVAQLKQDVAQLKQDVRRIGILQEDLMSKMNLVLEVLEHTIENGKALEKIRAALGRQKEDIELTKYSLKNHLVDDSRHLT